MPPVEFVGQSKQDPDNIGAATSRLLNCYREMVGGRTQYVLKGVLGMVPFAETGGIFMRAMMRHGGFVYVIAGGKLFRVTEDGAATEIGTVVDSENTTISSNGSNLTIVAGGAYYVWDGTSLTQPATGAFDFFGSVTYMGYRTVLTEQSGRKIQWSDVADPASLQVLDFDTADASDFDIIRALALSGILWVFTEGSVEKWQQVSDGFAVINGSAAKIGLKAHDLICETTNGAFFVGADNKVYVISGGSLVPVSSIAVETSIKSQEPTSTFYYQDEGHEFCVVRFRDRPAWCFDLSSGEWHERAQGAEFRAWSGVDSVFAFDKWIVGDELGRLHTLERVSTDRGEALLRRAVGRSFVSRRFRVAEVEIRANVGARSIAEDAFFILTDVDGEVVTDVDGTPIAEVGTQYRGPQVALRISKDYGKTFGAPKIRDLGGVGEYSKRVTWRALGYFDASMTPEITWTDAADITIDATAEVTAA